MATQAITWWAAVPNQFDGVTFSAPKVLFGRWEDRTMEVTGADGKTLVSKAVAFLKQDVKAGDYLCLGDQMSAPDPTLLSAAYSVMVFQKIPSLNVQRFERKAIM